MTPNFRLLALITVLAGAVASPSVVADEFPSRTVSIVVPFSAGGGFDAMARIIAENMKETLGQGVIVENKPGADGILAATTVAAAAPDGHTLFLALDSIMTLMPHVRANLKYDTQKDFAPITLVSSSPLLLVANPKLPVNNLQELATYTKANPDKTTVGSAAIKARVFMEMFKSATGGSFTVVPYRGSPQLVTGLLSGEIDWSVAESSTYIPLIDAGKLRAIATTGAKIAALPQVRTVAESGYPALEMDAWAGLFAPARTPAEVVARLNQLVSDILRDEKVRQQITALGRDIETSTPEALATKVRLESAKWALVIQSSGIKFD